MDAVIRDLRETVRQLRRRPVFSATAIITLAIGMGVNTVAFSVVNGLLFKGFASKVTSDVGRIVTRPGGDESGNASLQEYERFAEATSGALDLAAEGRLSMAWHHDNTTDTAWVLAVSSKYFSMVTADVIAGRLSVEPVSGSSPSVVIGERFWREKLAAVSLAGLTLRLNNADVNVAGVIAESFTGPAGLYSPDIWIPLEELPLFGASPALQKRDTRWLFVLGRLGEGASAAKVQGQLDTAVAMMARDWPETHKDRGARFRMLGEGNSELRGLATGAAIGMGLISLVLLLACFNVANLLLARAVERERDMGIRTALGASPARLTRLVLIEGFVIAVGAGALALVIAWWAQSLVSSFAIPIEEPQHIDFTPDMTMAFFIVGLVIVAGVLPGLWPALAAARVDVVRVLGSQSANSASGKPSAMRRWLVGAQIAGSTAFLAIALLFVQSLGQIVDLDLGFARDHLVVAQFDPASNGYSVDAAERYADALVARARSLPGVADVALVNRAPFFIGFERVTPVWPDRGNCDGGSCPKVATLAAGPGYFRTIGIRLVAGREFEPTRGSVEVVVNQPFALQQWPDGRGLGETIRLGERGAAVTVVGITGKHRTRGLDRERPTIYLPIDREQYEEGLSLVVRTEGEPLALVRLLEEAARAVDPNVSMLAVKTMEQRMGVQMWPFRTLSRVFAICGSLALVLATVGLAGAVIHAVSRRQREFGVRVSIGATPRDLVADVLRSSLALLLPGLAIGTILAASVARLIQVVFLGVNVLNPLTYLAVALLQTIIVIVACLAPALRAARVDPLVALRAE
jgi:putative ABC transport system permease protein